MGIECHRDSLFLNSGLNARSFSPELGILFFTSIKFPCSSTSKILHSRLLIVFVK